MKCIGIIPARYKSSRFEGKIIADLCGKPVIQYVYENASKSDFLQQVIIATDDIKVKEVVESFDAEVMMTSKNLNSGTERVIEVLNKRKINSDIIVNIQADEPMIKTEMIDQLVNYLAQNKTINVATLKKKITKKNELFDSNVVKVVTDKNNFALYFSRSVIPFISNSSPDYLYHYKHIGIYAYRKNFLLKLATFPESRLEKVEKLEQLKILENGDMIKVIDTRHETIGIDTPNDLQRVEGIFKRQEKKSETSEQ